MPCRRCSPKAAGGRLAQEHETKIHDLHARIGELTVERYFSARVEALSRVERMGMIELDGPLSLSRRCVLLGVSRSTGAHPRAWRTRSIGSSPTCCAASRSRGRTMSGALTSLCFVAAIDWATRHVLSWRLSNALDTRFGTGALDDALIRATFAVLQRDLAHRRGGRHEQPASCPAGGSQRPQAPVCPRVRATSPHSKADTQEDAAPEA